MPNVYVLLASAVIGAGFALYTYLISSRPQLEEPPRPRRETPSRSQRNRTDFENVNIRDPCIVCDDPSQVRLMPCKHAPFCEKCCYIYATEVTFCPLCRLKVAEVIPFSL